MYIFTYKIEYIWGRRSNEQMYDEGKQYTYNVHIPAVVSCTYQGNKKKEREGTRTAEYSFGPSLKRKAMV